VTESDIFMPPVMVPAVMELRAEHSPAKCLPNHFSLFLSYIDCFKLTN